MGCSFVNGTNSVPSAKLLKTVRKEVYGNIPTIPCPPCFTDDKPTMYSLQNRRDFLCVLGALGQRDVRQKSLTATKKHTENDACCAWRKASTYNLLQ